MAATKDTEPAATRNRTTAQRKSDREIVVTRTVNGPARVVFDAFTKPELFTRWWIPKSFGISIVSCEMDVRVGGSYRLVLRHPASNEPMAFFGKYVEVAPHTRLTWTNEEGGEAGAVTTVTLEEKAGQTLVVLSDLYRSKQALDDAIASGATSGTDESCGQLDELVTALGAK